MTGGKLSDGCGFVGFVEEANLGVVVELGDHVGFAGAPSPANEDPVAFVKVEVAARGAEMLLPGATESL